jgi:nitrate/TMAO reductase-like tetraheme cytochrome c subunit
MRASAITWLCVCLWLAGCRGGEPAPAPLDAGIQLAPDALSLEQLRDPESCKGCHPVHYREWSGSMHAYAAKDPVFIAMNKRGQRETKGALGDFCVKCHAPMAVFDKLTTDGLNLAQLPDKDRGVSCYFCHNVSAIEGDHNGKLRVANDNTMRGPIHDPFKSPAHAAEFSEILDESNAKSSAMCGGCHDVVTPSGVRLERTYQEYLTGIFSKSASGEPPAFDSCVGCHMPPHEGLVATAPEGVKPRELHEHLWPGIDVALTAFPHSDALRSAVEDCKLGATSVAFFTLEVTPPNLFTFQLETGAGHNQPSGSSQDRRLWLEFLAYDKNGELLTQVSSGNIAEGEIEEKLPGEAKYDPHLLMFRDRIYDAAGEPVHMFWEAAKSKAYPTGYVSQVLPGLTTTYVEGKNTVVKQYRASGPDGMPARVTARLKMRPIGLDVLQDLVDSGDLDPKVMAQMPTYTFGAEIEWTPADGLMKPLRAKLKSDCTSYRCLLDPSAPDCQ